MSTSFIVTTFDVLPWIDQCLDSLAACTRPGDRVILVDDGSGDGTDLRLEERARHGLGPEVEVITLLLAVNTMGGVGIPANTGLARALADADCDGIFFVDGDDWLDPAGFAACRDDFAAGDCDMLICAYDEYDEASAGFRPPSDLDRWAEVAAKPAGDITAARDLALRLNPVPWRKFYRADFLRRHGLRFPEGDFFFEDNPFHWEVCLRADRIRFSERLLCHHRVNRPGQTMMATGAELAAFFEHHATIRARVADLDPGRRDSVSDWLIDNMHWHLERLQPAGYWPYATRAAAGLAALPPEEWAVIARRHGQTSIGAMASALRNGNIPGVVTAWMQAGHIRRQESEMASLRDRIAAVEAELRSRPRHSAAEEISRFQALLALPHPRPPTG